MKLLVFTELSKDELKKIIELMFKEVMGDVEAKGMTMDVTEAVKEFILEKGYNAKYGARPLRRTIQKYIEDELSELFIRGNSVRVLI